MIIVNISNLHNNNNNILQISKAIPFRMALRQFLLSYNLIL